MLGQAPFLDSALLATFALLALEWRAARRRLARALAAAEDGQ
jgi:hypothetical protein